MSRAESSQNVDVESQSNIISESQVKKLNLAVQKTNISIQGINKKCITSSQTTKATIMSRTNTFSKEILCLVLHRISSNLPSNCLQNLYINIPTNIELADSDFSKSRPIDLLIGAGLF